MTAPPAARRLLALGDSYTIGEGLPPEARWPSELVRLLRERGEPVEEPVVIATTGWTTDELAAGIAAASPPPPFDAVSLLIGVNDQYRGRTVDEYRAGFVALLHQAIAFAAARAGKVVVLSIPDWGVTPFADGRDRAAIAREIDAFNAVNYAEATRAGARYVDVTGIARDAGAGAVVGDGLHPSADVHAAWARAALPSFAAALAALAA